jgi:multidrug resistance efflux pump
MSLTDNHTARVDLARAAVEAAEARLGRLEAVREHGNPEPELTLEIEALENTLEALRHNLDAAEDELATAEPIFRRRVVEAIDSFKAADNPVWRKEAVVKLRCARQVYEAAIGRPAPGFFCVECFSRGPAFCGRDIDDCDRRCREVLKPAARGA